MKYLLGSACAVFMAMSGAPAKASTFDIILNFLPAGEDVTNAQNEVVQTSTFGARQQQLLNAAGDFWSDVITGFTGVTEPISLIVDTAFAPIDGVNRGLAFAGPRGRVLEGPNPATGGTQDFIRAVTGFMQFDIDDYGGTTFNEQQFLDVAVHEIAHVLGFGTLFDDNFLVDPVTSADNNVDTLYIGAQAVAAFNELTGQSATSILMDSIGGHWNECYVQGSIDPDCSDSPADGGDFFNDAEILTTFVANGASELSPVTIASLRDLGYLTSDQGPVLLPSAATISAVPLPAGGMLLLTGLAGFAMVRRKQS